MSLDFFDLCLSIELSGDSIFNHFLFYPTSISVSLLHLGMVLSSPQMFTHWYLLHEHPVEFSPGISLHDHQKNPIIAIPIHHIHFI